MMLDKPQSTHTAVEDSTRPVMFLEQRLYIRGCLGSRYSETARVSIIDTATRLKPTKAKSVCQSHCGLEGVGRYESSSCYNIITLATGSKNSTWSTSQSGLSAVGSKGGDLVVTPTTERHPPRRSKSNHVPIAVGQNYC